MLYFYLEKKNSKQQMLPNKTFKQQQQQDRKQLYLDRIELKKKAIYTSKI